MSGQITGVSAAKAVPKDRAVAGVDNIVRSIARAEGVPLYGSYATFGPFSKYLYVLLLYRWDCKYPSPAASHSTHAELTALTTC